MSCDKKIPKAKWLQEVLLNANLAGNYPACVPSALLFYDDKIFITLLEEGKISRDKSSEKISLIYTFR
jgi:hypothetical protein